MTEDTQIAVSQKNGRKIVTVGAALGLGIVANLVYGGMEWQKVTDTLGNHEIRISRLEVTRPDETAAEVVQQNAQIEKLISAVQIDHDSIVTLKAIFEGQNTQQNGRMR